MKFTVPLNGIEFKFSFSRNSYNKTVSCYVSKKDDEDKWVTYLKAVSKCNCSEKFNLWFGRKLALSRIASNFSIEERRSIWNSYFDAIAAPLATEMDFEVEECNNPITIMNITQKYASMWEEQFNPSKVIHKKFTKPKKKD